MQENTAIDLRMLATERAHSVPRRLLNFLWRLFQFVLLLAPFLILDWFHTASMQRTVASLGKTKNCQVADRVRHHAFEPSCVTVAHWGRDSYTFATNSLGFRDQRVRDVPLTDARPRLLLLGDSMTEGKIAWQDSYVGRIAAHFPHYDVLNGGVASYSPSNYLNTTRILLAKGVDFDEVIASSTSPTCRTRLPSTTTGTPSAQSPNPPGDTTPVSMPGGIGVWLTASS
jgi:hypothetical protein